MMKYVVLALVLLVVIWLFFGRKQRSDGDAQRPGSDDPSRSPAAPPAQAQSMVACAHCGLHLPRAEALADGDGRLYCGPAHRVSGPSPSD